MEYLAKKSFSFLQDCVFTSTNKWNILQKSRFRFCKIAHLPSINSETYTNK